MVHTYCILYMKLLVYLYLLWLTGLFRSQQKPKKLLKYNFADMFLILSTKNEKLQNHELQRVNKILRQSNLKIITTSNL